MRRRVLLVLALVAAAGSIAVVAVADGTSTEQPTPRAPRAQSAAVRCDRVAAPSGSDGAAGTEGRPFATAARLVRSLRAGDTGCLRAGTYRIAPMLEFHRAGTAEAPITLRSYPGERATLAGGTVTILQGADHVQIAGLTIDGSGRNDVTVWILGADAVLRDSTVTNRTRGLSCVFLGAGSARQPPALRSQIRRNRIEACGNDAHGDKDHGVYAAQARDAVIADNLLRGSDGWGVQLYPSAQHVRVIRNTIVGNGGGVIFGGNSRQASSNNVVERNVITDARETQLVQSYWEGPVGRGNVARRNCFGHAPHGATSGDAFRLEENVTASPLYIAPSRGDFRLGEGTGCSAVIGSPPAPGAPASVARGTR